MADAKTEPKSTSATETDTTTPPAETAGATEPAATSEAGGQTPVTVDQAAGVSTEWDALHDGIQRDPNDESPVKSSQLGAAPTV